MSRGTGNSSASGSITCHVCKVTLSSFMSYQIHCSGYLHSSNLATANVAQKTQTSTAKNNQGDAQRKGNNASSSKSKGIDMFDPFIDERDVLDIIHVKRKQMRREQQQRRWEREPKKEKQQHVKPPEKQTLKQGNFNSSQEYSQGQPRASTSTSAGYGASANPGPNVALKSSVIDLTNESDYMNQLVDYQKMRDQQSVLQSQLALLKAATKGSSSGHDSQGNSVMDSAIQNTLAAMDPTQKQQHGTQNQPAGHGTQNQPNVAPYTAATSANQASSQGDGLLFTPGAPKVPLTEEDLPFYYSHSLRADDAIAEDSRIEKFKNKPFCVITGKGNCPICPSGKYLTITRAIDWFSHVEGKKHEQSLKALLRYNKITKVKKEYGIHTVPQKYLSQIETYTLIQDVFLHYDKMFPAQMQKAIKENYCAFILTTGQKSQLVCKLCKFNARYMSEWIYHVLSYNHAKACITELMKKGLHKYIQEYDGIPGPNPQNIWPITKQFPLCLLPGIQGSEEPMAPDYQWSGFFHMDLADPKNNMVSRLKDGKRPPIRSFQSKSPSVTETPSLGKTIQAQGVQATTSAPPLMSLDLNNPGPSGHQQPPQQQNPKAIGRPNPTTARHAQSQRFMAPQAANAQKFARTPQNQNNAPPTTSQASASAPAAEELVALVQQKVQDEVRNSVQQNTVLLKAFLGALVQKMTTDGQEKSESMEESPKKVVLDYSHGKTVDSIDHRATSSSADDNIMSKDMEISEKEEKSDLKKKSSAIIASAPWKSQSSSSTSRRDDQTLRKDDRSSRSNDRASRKDDRHDHTPRDDQTSRRDDQKSGRDDRTSRRDDQKSGRDDQTSRQDDRTSRKDDRGSFDQRASNEPDPSRDADGDNSKKSLIKWTYKKWNKQTGAALDDEPGKPAESHKSSYVSQESSANRNVRSGTATVTATHAVSAAAPIASVAQGHQAMGLTSSTGPYTSLMQGNPAVMSYGCTPGVAGQIPYANTAQAYHPGITQVSHANYAQTYAMHQAAGTHVQGSAMYAQPQVLPVASGVAPHVAQAVRTGQPQQQQTAQTPTATVTSQLQQQRQQQQLAYSDIASKAAAAPWLSKKGQTAAQERDHGHVAGATAVTAQSYAPGYQQSQNIQVLHHGVAITAVAAQGIAAHGYAAAGVAARGYAAAGVTTPGVAHTGYATQAPGAHPAVATPAVAPNVQHAAAAAQRYAQAQTMAPSAQPQVAVAQSYAAATAYAAQGNIMVAPQMVQQQRHPVPHANLQQQYPGGRAAQKGQTATQAQNPEVQKAFAMVDQARNRADQVPGNREDHPELQRRDEVVKKGSRASRWAENYDNNDSGTRNARIKSNILSRRYDAEDRAYADDGSAASVNTERSHRDDRRKLHEREFEDRESRLEGRLRETSQENRRHKRLEDSNRLDHRNRSDRNKIPDDTNRIADDRVRRSASDDRYRERNHSERVEDTRDDTQKRKHKDDYDHRTSNHGSDREYRSQSGDGANADDDRRARRKAARDRASRENDDRRREFEDPEGHQPRKDHRRKEGHVEKTRRDRDVGYSHADYDESFDVPQEGNSRDAEYRSRTREKEHPSRERLRRGESHRGQHDHVEHYDGNYDARSHKVDADVDHKRRQADVDQEDYDERRLTDVDSRREKRDSKTRNRQGDFDGREAYESRHDDTKREDRHRKRRHGEEEDLYGKRRYEEHYAEEAEVEVSHRRHGKDKHGRSVEVSPEHAMKMRVQQLIHSLGIRDEAMAAPLVELAAQMNPVDLDQLLNPAFLTAVGQLREVLENGEDPSVLGTLLNSDVMKDEGVYQFLQLLGLDVQTLRVLHCNPNMVQDEDPFYGNQIQHGNANQGQHGNANQGQRGNANQGQRGNANQGQRGNANQGQRGNANQGQRGNAKQGQRGNANQGQRGNANQWQRGNANQRQRGNANQRQRGNMNQRQRGKGNQRMPGNNITLNNQRMPGNNITLNQNHTQ